MAALHKDSAVVETAVDRDGDNAGQADDGVQYVKGHPVIHTGRLFSLHETILFSLHETSLTL